MSGIPPDTSDHPSVQKDDDSADRRPVIVRSTSAENGDSPSTSTDANNQSVVTDVETEGEQIQSVKDRSEIVKKEEEQPLSSSQPTVTSDPSHSQPPPPPPPPTTTTTTTNTPPATTTTTNTAAVSSPEPSSARHPPLVADPEPFPHPTIRRSHLRRVGIRINETVVETKTIIHSGSGSFYEIGATLKKAIFGHVIHAIQLEVSETNPEEFRRTSKQMAIKVYSKRMLRQLQGRTQENPLMEITALQYIGNDHPHLMGQIECCTDEENIYSIMRYCQGGELFDFIDENGPLTNPQAKKMFKQLLSGLQRLQELGIGHRDLSLENILYDHQELYVIIDFGMCLRLKKHPQIAGEYCYIHKQQICGKKNYIAPEVLREDPIFNPMIADIWAAGIILFIILTGVPPIDKATHADIRYTMICEGRLHEMVTNWNIDLEPLAVDLIQRLLKSDPSERPSLAEIFQHEWLRDA